MRNLFSFSRRLTRLAQTASFYQGFWDGWAELLALHPAEDEPSFTWMEHKSVEEALKSDVIAVAGDFREALRKADTLHLQDPS